MTTKPKPIEEAYFDWLISHINVELKHRPRKTYDFLFHKLLDREFFWVVANDDNRIQDGKDLRDYFGDEVGLSFADFEAHLEDLPVSVMEVLIGLSKRMAFQTGRIKGNAEDWAWKFIVNLDLQRFYDPISPRGSKTKQIDDILDNLIWRQYDRNGQGGFFPLVDTHEDQTKVEMWYQMAAYIREMHIL